MNRRPHRRVENYGDVWVFVCVQTDFFYYGIADKLGNRLTVEHLSSLLKVISSQLDLAFEDILANQKQFHMSHTSTVAGTSNKN